MRVRLIRIGIAHHIAVDIAARGNGIQQRRVDRLQGRLQIGFYDAMQLDRLSRGQPHGAVTVVARDLVERQPLHGGEDTAGNANADHEGERLLHFLARALGPQIAVVL